MNITLTPIAHVINQRAEVSDDYWGGVVSKITLTDKFTADAFKGLEEFSHVEVIFYFDKADKSNVITGSRHPRGNKSWPEVGIFAQRGKDRPNHIGLTIAEITEVNGTSLFVTGLDAVDGTPVLDIKPLVREFLPQSRVDQPKWVTELMKNYWKKG